MAGELGRRRADDGIGAVFCSDLARAAETAAIAFGVDRDSGAAGLAAARVRLRTGQRDAVGRASGGPRDHLDEPYPGGESWRQAVDRVGRFLADLPLRWDGQRVVVIGHVATRWGLDHHLNGVALETLVAEEFAWQPGWEYRLS